MPGTQNVWSINRTLTNISIMPPAGTYIADVVAPVYETTERSAKIASIDPTFALKRNRDTSRAPGTPAKRFDIDLTRPVTVTPTDHALDGMVPDEDRGSADVVAEDAMDIVSNNREAIYLAKEIELVALIASTFTGGATSSPTNKWNQDAGTFFADIDTKIDSIKTSSGVKPNALACDESVIRKIGLSANFREFVKRTRGIEVTYGRGGSGLRNVADAIAIVSGLDFVDYADIALTNSAEEGQTASLSNVWGENVFLYRKDPPRRKTMNSLLTVVWNGMSAGETGGVRNGWRVRQWYDTDLESWKYRVGRWYHQVALNSATGHLFTNTLA